ncbi:MAG TPA: protein kinase [Bryobacteraceae bacterium]|nr:protein kinase [Bryobacteraceae bacterium]
MSQTFGRYTVVGQLGRGAMGVVYLASDPLLNRQVAVKTVDLGVDDPSEREFLRNRLLRDARAAAVLKHPNIVSIYDVFEDGERAYVVMEYVEGDSLSARLKANPLPDAATFLQVLRQTADALDYTHSRGVIHRDIKPANLMIDHAGTAKVMDFGIARINDTRTSTPTGMVMGTVEYMAPEQIRGETVDGRADQFSLAVVAYQMMTGSTLFGPNTLATLTYKIVNEAPPPASTRNAALPRGVDVVLAKALAKTPSERFTNCGEFVGALAQAFSDVPTIQVGPTPMVAGPTQPLIHGLEPTAPAKRSRSAALAVVVAVLGLGGALAIWKPWNRGSPQPPAQVTAVSPATENPGPTSEPVAPTPIAPPRPHLQDAEPKKVVSTSRPVTPPPVASEPVEPPEPTAEAEVLPPPPVPKTGTSPTPFDTAVQRAHEQMKSKDFAGAIQSYTKAIGLRPNFAPAHFNRGVAQHNLEHEELAIQNYSEAIRLAPDMAIAFSARGVALVRLRRDPEALMDFQHALELKPGLANALNGRGGIYFRRKQYRMALADYDAAIHNNPRFAQAYLNRAQAREAVGDFGGAATDRKREAELRKQ